MYDISEWWSNMWIGIGNNILLSLIDGMYWICLFSCMILVIIYGCGYKKAGKWATIIFVIYFLSQCCKVGLR